MERRCRATLWTHREAIDQHISMIIPLDRRGEVLTWMTLLVMQKKELLHMPSRVRRELFLFAEEDGDRFLFLLEDTSDIGGDIRILGRPNDAQGHASRVF